MNNVDRFKQGFFDRGSVLTAMDRATRNAMVSTGAYARTVARNSMKKRKNASRPGQPPHVHVGTLKELTYFAYDHATRSMVVGPVGLGKSKVPGTLEFGDGRIAERPYMRPALDKAKDRFAGKVRFGATTNTNQS